MLLATPTDTLPVAGAYVKLSITPASTCTYSPSGATKTRLLAASFGSTVTLSSVPLTTFPPKAAHPYVSCLTSVSGHEWKAAAAKPAASMLESGPWLPPWPTRRK
ncbi:uncharacterized protein K452DRAFT_276271 [Neofusicoccum parvum]|nr:uncharacterized protein K452DRAFT_276271 [Neofusicoccum parvum]